MKSKLAKFILLVATFLGSYYAVTLGMNISYAKQASLLSEIRNVSAIIFGVTGAWLALVYPKALASTELALKAANDAVYEQAQHDNNVLLGFIKTIITSIVVIAISVGIPFVKEVAVQISFLNEYRNYLRGILFFTIVVLAIIQLYLLFATFLQTKSALKDVKGKIAEAKTRNERSHNQRH
ncbi:hypothetical protein A136_19710 [Vibrio crassostreae 9ZC13]|uniref:hypothetical protein n=1 Tax=Vibrio crassostreae TaxID=246167 RepID=UPI000361B4B5|nr:hypothetical protein [Vibrio crassostreae]OEE98915.1 hypothetical protein A136_19710 [Vibrio crassostreae 9ZC13]